MGSLVLIRNSRRDSRKGDKMLDKYLGPYEVVEVKNNGIYSLKNIKTGKKLVNMVNVAGFKMFKGTHYKVSKHNQPVIDEVSVQDDDKSGMQIARRK